MEPSSRSKFDMSKPWVMRRGDTVIGFDPGDPRGDRGCTVVMKINPDNGHVTVTQVNYGKVPKWTSNTP